MRYKTIVIDPPWRYKQSLAHSEHTRGSAEKTYRTMSDEEILNLKIADFANGDCQLWVWATNSHLHLAFHCIEEWGFIYKTMATWVKTNFGLGYWLRGQTEHILLAVRGNPRRMLTGPHGASGNNFSTLIYAKRTSHSEKPQTFFDMVEAAGESPRLEIFGRKLRLGWDTIGDKVGISL